MPLICLPKAIGRFEMIYGRDMARKANPYALIFIAFLIPLVVSPFSAFFVPHPFLSGDGLTFVACDWVATTFIFGIVCWFGFRFGNTSWATSHSQGHVSGSRSRTPCDPGNICAIINTARNQRTTTLRYEN
jgi:hypothetical protein